MAATEPAPAAAAEPTSTRLMKALRVAADAGLVEFIGGSGYMVRVVGQVSGYASVVRSGSTEEMFSWLNGFRRGRMLPGPDGWWSAGGVQAAADRLVAARDEVAEMRGLLVRPSLADQLRIHILAAIEGQGLTFVQVAERIDRDPQSVRNALLLGKGLPRRRHSRGDIFDLMLDALQRPAVLERDPPVPGVDVVAALRGPRIEPAGLTRMRALVIAVERRLVDGVSPAGLQKARRARTFQVRVAGHDVRRPRETLLHWLRGVADGAGDAAGMIALDLQ